MTWRSLNVIAKDLQSSESHQTLREWIESIPGLSLWVQPRSEPQESYWVIEFEGAHLAKRLGVQITRELDRPASLGSPVLLTDPVGRAPTEGWSGGF